MTGKQVKGSAGLLPVNDGSVGGLLGTYVAAPSFAGDATSGWGDGAHTATTMSHRLGVKQVVNAVCSGIEAI